MGFASPAALDNISSPYGSGSEINNSHDEACNGYSSCEVQDNWLGQIVPTGVGVDAGQPQGSFGIRILQDIVQGSLALHGSLSISPAGQLGGQPQASWMGGTVQLVPCIGANWLMPSTNNSASGQHSLSGSTGIPSISCAPKQHHSNSDLRPHVSTCTSLVPAGAAKFSCWASLDRENGWDTNNSLVFDLRAITVVPDSSTVPAGLRERPPEQVPATTAAAAPQGVQSDMQAQLQEWLADMEARAACAVMYSSLT